MTGGPYDLPRLTGYTGRLLDPHCRRIPGDGVRACGVRHRGEGGWQVRLTPDPSVFYTGQSAYAEHQCYAAADQEQCGCRKHEGCCAQGGAKSAKGPGGLGPFRAALAPNSAAYVARCEIPVSTAAAKRTSAVVGLP